ncbi:MAG: hypothetical protein HKN33_12590 [Pyrinomonadaceae bacterium]|nr:hypothetical protein [Pyrinomonadaceae bacterium]
MKLLVFSLLSLLLFLSPCSRMESRSIDDTVPWVRPTVNGIVLGKFKHQDVIDLLGKPMSEEEIQQFEVPEEEWEDAMNYRLKIDGIDGWVGVIYKSKSTLVTHIELVPEVEMNKKEAIEKYGPDYFVTSNNDSKCIPVSRKNREYRGKPEYPISIVYPKRGMYVGIREDGSVMHINYTDKCE